MKWVPVGGTPQEIMRDDKTKTESADGLKPEADLIPTRWSLIRRLKNWDDQESWRDFFETYWRLIYRAARRSGLNAFEAEEVVQDTIISVCRGLKDFDLNPARGSFKNWLFGLTRWRILDRLRKQARQAAVTNGRAGSAEALAEQVPDPAANELEALWEAEWRQNLLAAALAKLKAQIKPKQFQVYYLHVIKEQPAREVSQLLRVNVGQVYLIKHRVGHRLKRLLKKLEQQSWI